MVYLWGAQMDPLLVDMFVRFLKLQLFDDIHKLYCYVYYVDDTFACFRHVTKH